LRLIECCDRHIAILRVAIALQLEKLSSGLRFGGYYDRPSSEKAE
jgi:hypothetical protein